MFDFASRFAAAEPYSQFLERYATPDQLKRWQAMHASIALSSGQTELLGSFIRQMKVLVMAGTWCGDCVDQCPIFDHFSAANPRIEVRFVDRDADPELAAELHICGAARVPAVVFLSEDDLFCGQAGDRTVSKYRQLAMKLTGAACGTGLVRDQPLDAAVLQDWLDEFERIQLMLRTSGRLRTKHGD